MGDQTPLKLIVVDDHALFRGGLISLLSTQADMKVVGEAATVKRLPELIVETGAQLVSIDLELSDDADVLTEVKSLLRKEPQIRILVVSHRALPGEVNQLVDAGVHGYITKGSPSDELLTAIRRLSSGDNYLCSEATRALISSQKKKKPALRLTKRQNDVLRLAAEGYTTSEIAQSLSLSPKTVENYRGKILKRLQAKNFVQALQLAVDEGLLA